MITTLRKKSQITIPSDIIKRLGLSEGDQFDIVEKNGKIVMLPIKTYPASYLKDLKSEVCEIREKIALGEQPVFDNIDALFEELEK